MFMHLFEKAYKDSYLRFHTKPIRVNTLDPRVFNFPDDGSDPVLQPAIRAQILKDIDDINKAEGVSSRARVFDYFIIGPVLKEKSSEKCPITVKVLINTANLTDGLKEKILNTIKNINDRLAPGTTHPLVYIPTIKPFDTEKQIAVYHPFTDKWIKTPRFLGESKNKIEDLAKIKTKRKPKQSLGLGIKKLGKL